MTTLQTTNCYTLDKQEAHIPRSWNTQTTEVSEQTKMQGLQGQTFINTSLKDNY